MAGSIYRRYMWLVRIIGQYPNGITFNEINERWMRCALNEEKTELSKRTFHNWLIAIDKTLGILIECTKSAPYKYIISNSDDTKDELMTWALNAFSIGQMAAENAEIKERILLESIPSANENLEVILSAMRANHRIKLRYKAFDSKEINFVTEPYAVKLSRKRWYVICHSLKYDKEYCYGIDRIVEVSETNETFKVRDGYSAEKSFEGCIGITNFGDTKISDVRLKITGYLRDYITTLPIHSSQELVEEADDYMVLGYRLRPDYELVDIICGMGKYCEVLAPLSLRKAVHEMAVEMAEKNK